MGFQNSMCDILPSKEPHSDLLGIDALIVQLVWLSAVVRTMPGKGSAWLSCGRLDLLVRVALGSCDR